MKLDHYLGSLIVKLRYCLPLTGIFSCMFASNLFAGNQILNNKFFEEVKSFCEREKVSYNDISKIMFDLSMNNNFLAKAGIGPIGGECYILLKDSKNALNVKGRVWRGEDRNTREMIFIEGGRVCHPNQVSDVSHSIMVVFEPSDVRIVDFAGGIGGIFKRSASLKSESQ